MIKAQLGVLLNILVVINKFGMVGAVKQQGFLVAAIKSAAIFDKRYPIALIDKNGISGIGLNNLGRCRFILFHTTLGNFRIKLEFAAAQFASCIFVIIIVAKFHLRTEAIGAFQVGKKFF